jgi:hypothetical protein
LAIFLGVAGAQYPIVDMLATKVVDKFQQASCDQLLANRGKPKTPKEEQAIQLLRGNPQIRTAFIDRVAAPIANKMFECGMIP